MKKRSENQIARIEMRRIREEQNPFSRLPAAYAAARLQGQRLLQMAGGLSIVEWRVLWDLVEAGPMTIGEMAEIQRIDPSQLSRALPSMRAKGFVVMGQDDRDGRLVQVAIAPAGQAAFDQAKPIMQRRRDALRDRFSEADLTQFIYMLGRFEAFCREPIEEMTNPEPLE